MHLWVRPEVSAEIGLGHIMRTIAVAEAARDAGDAVTYVPSGSDELASLPARRGFHVLKGSGPAWLEAIAPDDAVLFDGYGFKDSDYAQASSTGALVAALDDFCTGAFRVDVLVNPSPIGDCQYSTPSHTKLLIGPQFALVRSEFRKHRRIRSGGAATLLLALGGSDATGLSGRLLSLLTRQNIFRRVLLVRGPAAAPLPRGNRAGWLDVVDDPEEVALTFDRADAAIAAAGATTWELLAMGMPTALVQVVDNQASVMGVVGLGGAIGLGRSETLPIHLPGALERLADPHSQRDLSRVACSLVDGLGGSRVLDALRRGRRPTCSGSV